VRKIVFHIGSQHCPKALQIEAKSKSKLISFQELEVP
jgi:hypothetical protein